MFVAFVKNICYLEKFCLLFLLMLLKWKGIEIFLYGNFVMKKVRSEISKSLSFTKL
jgi:hypothetical protein